MRRLTVLALSVLSLSVSVPAMAGSVVKTLPGPDGGWDYAHADPDGHRLYVARSSSVTVYDLVAKTPAKSIGQIVHGHAVLPIPHTETLLVTSGQDATVRFLDSRDGRETARLTVGANPDAAVLNASGNTAYVMNAKDGTISKIDIPSHSVTATITLMPGLEYAALSSDGTLFVNNEDENSLTSVDTRRNSVSSVLPLTGCDAPSGLGYDAHTGRLIAACANGKAAVVDAKAGKLLGLLDIGQGPDAVIVDEAHRRAYIPCGTSGELDVVALDATGGPTVVDHIKTDVGARTGALDPKTGMIYLPTGKFGPAPAGSKRGAMVPGSFHILVVRP